jgi:hypothetical protein
MCSIPKRWRRNKYPFKQPSYSGAPDWRAAPHVPRCASKTPAQAVPLAAVTLPSRFDDALPILLLLVLGLGFTMQIQIELTEESRELLLRHFKESAPLHEVLARAQRNELAGVGVYSFECDLQQATELLEMARDHCPPAVKDIEHAIFAATAG